MQPACEALRAISSGRNNCQLQPLKTEAKVLTAIRCPASASKISNPIWPVAGAVTVAVAELLIRAVYPTLDGANPGGTTYRSPGAEAYPFRVERLIVPGPMPLGTVNVKVVAVAEAAVICQPATCR